MMEMKIVKKRFKTGIYLLLLLFTSNSCSLYDFQNEKTISGTDQQVIYPETIGENTILPEAKKYYQNLSLLARWYSKNPLFRVLPTLNSPSDVDNSVLRKLSSIRLIDSTGMAISVFDLDEKSQKEFLDSWTTVEAHQLSQKLKKDPLGTSMQLFTERNIAFTKAIGNLKSNNLNEDPFFAVKRIMDEQEKEKIAHQPELPNFKSGEPTDDYFWATIIANGLMSLSVIQVAPNKLSAQTFVDRIRPNIEKGRLLVSLPGGWTTTSLIVFYPNKLWYDVGHVAVISKNLEEIPDSIGYDYEFTIGTGVEETHIEGVGERWCRKHGLAFLCQISATRWEMYNETSSKKWKWRKVVTDIDGEALVEKTASYIGVKYCSTFDVFISKWVAPETFICSSLAWYCTREISGIDISDWWSTSVYPVDILFNENIRVIDDTLE
jgi:hypothetical protein